MEGREMNWQSELAQGLAVIGLINVVGQLTGDKGLTDLSVQSQAALALGATCLQAPGSPAQAADVVQVSGSSGPGTGYSDASIPFPVAFFGALILVNAIKSGGGSYGSDMAKQQSPATAERPGRAGQ